MSLPIGLQLFTVRDPLAADYEGTLANVAAAGYRYIEASFPAPGDRTPADVRDLCARLGLKITSLMYPLTVLRDNLSDAIAAAKTVGCDCLVAPSPPAEDRDSVEGYRRTAQALADANARAAAQGMTVCYHNHSFEFATLADGSVGMDHLIANPGVYFELDVYWVQHGRRDPVELLRKLRNRVPIVHVKDMDKTEKRSFAEVGTGVIDIAAIVREAQTCGAKFLVIEQDGNWIDGDPIKSAALSLRNLTAIAG